jgi:hypothetical protein
MVSIIYAEYRLCCVPVKLFMLSVVMMNVVMLNVVAPHKGLGRKY